MNEGITFIIGESGGGKSTILKLINRYVVPTEGNIYYHEQPITAFPIVSYRRKVPLLSQTPFSLKVVLNIIFSTAES
ncbi:ABC transporter ATP-binding protein [Bacillus coahuilensis]|uniref:ATP-binding cassette domain-containing protein n=1 Tax=Bacillus coahuilensis TaxID=408580 RepID=UPI003B43D022